MTISTKTFTALAAATTLGLAAFATAQPAQAHHHHHHHHHRHAGVVIAPVGPAYAYSGAYGCHWKRQRVLDSWGWHVRRVRVCV